MHERAGFQRQFINNFRETILRNDLSMNLTSSINFGNYSTIDGKSLKQENSYDCGVFAMANVENYIKGPLNFPISTSLMKLIRCRYLYKLLRISHDVGYVEIS